MRAGKLSPRGNIVRRLMTPRPSSIFLLDHLTEYFNRGHECSLSGVRLTRRRCLEMYGPDFRFNMAAACTLPVEKRATFWSGLRATLELRGRFSDADVAETANLTADIAAEFERESKNPNPCVGTTLLSENERTRVWIIRLAPASASASIVTFWITFGPRFPAAADACMCVMARRSSTPTNRRDTARELRQGRIQSSRSGKSRRSRDGFHNRRVQGQCL
jgi:hypothetical protein